MPPSVPDSHNWAQFARAAIARAIGGGDGGDPIASPEPERLHAGVFATLHQRGRLRGCMGLLDAGLPLADAVRQAAQSAAQHDPRFPPVTPAELASLEIEVSILSDPVPMQSLDDLVLGRHGIIVRRGGRRGLFLPQVAVEHRMTKEMFLERCCDEKADLPADAWRDPATEVLLFTTEIHRE
jgi:AmmeMemoRadiSam system protein A